VSGFPLGLSGAHEIVMRLHFFQLATVDRPVMLVASQDVDAGVRRVVCHECYSNER